MENNYVPYGEEWRKEMKKLTKDVLIDMLANSFQKKIKLEKQLNKQ